MKNQSDSNMNRREFVKSAMFTTAGIMAMPSLASSMTASDSDMQVMDLHVHLTNSFTIEKAMEVSRQRNMKFGILEHPAPEGWLASDADLKRYIDNLRQYPVFIGIQPIYLGWSKNFSKEVLDQLDYVLMDPQTIPQDDGSYLKIWWFNAYVDDEEEFMTRYMKHCMNILHNEPIHIFSWPLSIPACIGRDYYKVWTPERKQAIISAAKERKIAIEINDMWHIPDEEFIVEAKKQGLKFTFGTDSRDPAAAGRLTYGMKMLKKCGITQEDLFIPAGKS